VNGSALATLRADFPGFKIWREVTPGRKRYVARSLHFGVNPHTVITADLSELRAALEPAWDPNAVAFSTARANIARMYAHWLNGKDAYQADRDAANTVLKQFPEVADIARANRAFLARAVRHAARQGVCQFIDAGSGLPDSPNVHEIARETAPDARVVYLDRDPVVLTHARALLAVDDNIAVMDGDIRDPAPVLVDPAMAKVIDPGQPVCVILGSVLHFLAAGEADESVALFRSWMAPGSYLIISAGTSTGTDPEFLRQLQVAYQDTTPVTARAAGEIQAWFDGFSLARPGVVDVWAWRPDSIVRPVPSRARMLAGVGRKPFSRDN
jgi:hypothetical protein